MNHAYRLVWNNATATYVPAPENARGFGKAGSVKKVVVATVMAAALGSASAWAADLPTGGQVTAGSGSISQNGSTLTLQQNSNKLIANWQGFDIAAGHTMNFLQPGTTAVALNRVLGSDGSKILGTLNANGRVFLVNPNGVIFGAGASVTVGGLVASTLDIADNDFLNDRYIFSGKGRSSGNATVINQGSIKADGGVVALLGGTVSNQGVIQASLGTVALAAGNKVTLDFAGDGLLNVTVDESTLDALVENRQLIKADGGSVLLTAQATDALLQTVVNNSGVIEARTLQNREGRIVLLGGLDGGTTEVAGTLDASAPDSGNGGFIETSGANVRIADSTVVTTQSAQGGYGNWLIDPTNFTVSAGSAAQSSSGIGATTLATSLGSSNVTLATSSAGSEAGDINVNAAVSWNAGTRLTLTAHNNINLNAAITVQNAGGGLTLNYAGDYNVSAPVTFGASGGSLSINGNNYTLVRTMAQLANINNAASGRYALVNDINASGTTYTDAVVGSTFTGTLAGLGHTVSNLKIASTNDYASLFGNAGSGSMLRDIGVVNANVGGNFQIAALVGYLDGGTVKNSYSSGLVTGNINVGGLVGYANNSATVTQSYSTAKVVGNNSVVGGLVGYANNNSKIIQSYATGAVSGTVGDVGGLLGRGKTGASITKSWASGSVTNAGEFSGGLAGRSDGAITQSYATGNVSGVESVGGLVGNSTGAITLSYATGNASGSKSVGGLVGSATGSSIKQSYATGNVTATTQWGGGFVGYNLATIDQAYSTGSVSGGGAASGAFIGGNSVTITKSYWNKDSSGSTVAFGTNSQPANTSVTGLTAAQMLTPSSFVGWDLDSVGGGSNAWRIYAGQTAPMLKAFLTRLNISNPTSHYTYSGSTLNIISSYSVPASANSSLVKGFLSASVRNVGSYSFSGLYSTQQGYDIVVSSPLIIDPKTVTISSANISKVYDGTTAASGSLAFLSGSLLGSDTASGATFAFTDVNAGSGKTVNIGNVVINDGNNGNNYNIVYAPNTTSTITKAVLTVSTDSASKTYDGTAYSGGSIHLSGFVNGESESVLTATPYVAGNAQGAINAGTYAIQAAGLAANNYSFDVHDGLLTINKAGLTITSSSVSKTYDGTVSASSTALLASGSTLFGTDSLSGGTFVFTDADAGNNKEVAVSGVTVNDGNGGGNYNISYASNNGSSIGKAQLTVTAQDAHKTYDATGYSGGNGASYAGLVNGESAAVLGGTLNYGGSAQGAVNAGSYVISLSGLLSGNYDIVFSNGALTVDKAALTIRSGDVSKSYDGTRSAAGIAVVSSGSLFGNDSLSGGSFEFTDKNAGSNKEVLVSAVTVNDGNAGSNYDISYASNTTSTISKAVVTVSGVVANDKTYDAGKGATLSNIGAVSTGVGTETLVLDQNGSISFDNKNAGSGKTVTVTGYSLADGGNGGLASNYQLQSTTATTTADIARAVISSVSDITASNKSYDAGTTATLGTGSASFNGILASDALTVATATGEFSDKNAQSGKTVNISGITLGGTDAGNYTLADNTATTTADISRAVISSVSGITANNKTYDAGTVATLGTGSAAFNGILASDVLSVVSATGEFSDKNAQNSKTVNISGITLGGTDAGNYTLADDTATTTADISRAVISSVSGITAGNKTYDAGTVATLGTGSAGFNGILASDVLSVASATGEFSDKNAQNSKTVNISGITLGGTDAGNYTLADDTATATADISRAVISSVSGITANNKTYDAGTVATLGTGSASFNGILASDVLSVASATGEFSDKNAQNSKTVNISSIVLGGTDAGNYTLSDTTATATADISRAVISSVSGITANNKTYDAGTAATLDTGTAGFNGRLGSDVLTVATATGEFSDKNAQDGKTVSISGISLSGVDAGNYSLADSTATTTADITPATISHVSGIGAGSKIYDGNDVAALLTAAASFNGILASDVLTVSAATGIFADRNAQSGKIVSISGITLGGTDAGNYRLADSTASTTADIGKALLTINGLSAGNKTYDASTTATLVSQGSLAGLIGSETLQLTHAAADFSDKDTATGKTVTVSGYSIADGDHGGLASNYDLQLTTLTTTADINKAVLTVTANDASRYFDGKTYGGGNGVSYSGFVAGEGTSLLRGAVVYGGNAQGARDAGRYSIAVSGLDADNYALAFVDGQLNIKLTTPFVTGAPVDGYAGAVTSAQTTGTNPVAAASGNAFFSDAFSSDSPTGETLTGLQPDAADADGEKTRQATVSNEELFRVVAGGIRMPEGL